MWNYSEKVIDHFMHPRNVGVIENPNAEAEVGSIACGDMLKIQLKVDDEGIIRDAKLKTFGCGSAIASASILTEMIIGKHVDEAAKITNKDIAESLGGLPEEKIHCSVMGRDALEAALANYQGQTRITPEEEDHSKLVCRCFGVTEDKIRRVVRENNLKTVEQVTHYCKAGGGCGACHSEIEDIIDDVWNVKAVDSPRRTEKPQLLTNIQKIALIQDTVEREIRPALRADGGDIELIDVDGDKVMVALRGACSECPASGLTLKGYVEQKLREFVSDGLYVEEVTQ
jgi:NifU-like protein